MQWVQLDVSIYSKIFLDMSKNIDRLITDLEDDKDNLDIIQNNLKNLDYVLNKIVYLKSHAVNIMFKDAIVVKKKQIDEITNM